MKIRILNNKPAGIYTNQFFIDNWGLVINEQLVSEWQLTELIPSETLLKPFWNGTEWIEGATPEEIAEANKPIVQNLKLEQYQELLQTDWYYTRYIETGQEVPLEIIQQRQEIRDKYNNLIQEINNE